MMNPSRRAALHVLAVALCASACSAQASTIVYDTITGNGSVVGVTAAIGDSATPGDLGPPQSSVYGFEFDDTVTGYISGLETGIESLSESTETFTAGVYSNNSGAVGSLIETLSITVLPDVNFGMITTNTYSSGATLQAGQSYWIVEGVGSFQPYGSEGALDNTKVATACEGTVSGNVASGSDCTHVTTLDFDVIPALQVSVQPVPLPAAIWMMLSGVGALGLMRRRTA